MHCSKLTFFPKIEESREFHCLGGTRSKTAVLRGMKTGTQAAILRSSRRTRSSSDGRRERRRGIHRSNRRGLSTCLCKRCTYHYTVPRGSLLLKSKHPRLDLKNMFHQQFQALKIYCNQMRNLSLPDHALFNKIPGLLSCTYTSTSARKHVRPLGSLRW